MNTQPINLYKQIIMHILHHSTESLPQSFVLDVITKLGYTDYIQAQSALGDLVESGLVGEDTTYHRTYISLTETGEETRRLFEHKLSPSIRTEIDQYLKSNHAEMRMQNSLISDYRRTQDGMYSVTCTLRDGTHILYEITMEVSDESDAIRMCDSWENKAGTLYTESLRLLLETD